MHEPSERQARLEAQFANGLRLLFKFVVQIVAFVVVTLTIVLAVHVADKLVSGELNPILAVVAIVTLLGIFGWIWRRY